MWIPGHPGSPPAGVTYTLSPDRRRGYVRWARAVGTNVPRRGSGRFPVDASAGAVVRAGRVGEWNGQRLMATFRAPVCPARVNTS
jgi:hypothetical protein